MACFLVPTAEAIVATIITKSIKANKKEPAMVKVETGSGDFEMVEKIPFSRKLKWLTNMLWGGAILLAFEHVWHGEVVPWFPFLTSASDPSDTAAMLHEMSTVGVSMALLVTAVWVCMLFASSMIEKRALKKLEPQATGN